MTWETTIRGLMSVARPYLQQIRASTTQEVPRGESSIEPGAVGHVDPIGLTCGQVERAGGTGTLRASFKMSELTVNPAPPPISTGRV